MTNFRGPNLPSAFKADFEPLEPEEGFLWWNGSALVIWIDGDWEPVEGTTLTAGDGLDLTGDVLDVDATVARKNIDNNFSANQTITGRVNVIHAEGVNARTPGDAFHRLSLRGDALALEFGPGDAAQDVRLTRGAADRLVLAELAGAGVNTGFVFGGTTLAVFGRTAGGLPGLQLGGDTALYRSGANELKASGDFYASNFFNSGAATYYGTLSAHATNIGASNTTWLKVATDGNIGLGNNLTPTAKLDVRIGAAGDVGLLVKGATSQTAALTEWQKSDGTVYGAFSLGSGTDGGRLSIRGSNGGEAGALYNAAGVVGGIYLAGHDNFTLVNLASNTADLSLNTRGSAGGVVGTTWRVYSGQTFTFQGNAGDGTVRFRDAATSLDSVKIDIGGAARVPLTVKGAASQTANLQEWQTSTSVLRMDLAPTGQLTVRGPTIDLLDSTAGRIILRSGAYPSVELRPDNGGLGGNFEYYNAAGARTHALASSGDTFYFNADNAGGEFYFRPAGSTHVTTIKGTGLEMQSGKTIKLNTVTLAEAADALTIASTGTAQLQVLGANAGIKIIRADGNSGAWGTLDVPTGSGFVRAVGNSAVSLGGATVAGLATTVIANSTVTAANHFIAFQDASYATTLHSQFGDQKFTGASGNLLVVGQSGLTASVPLAMGSQKITGLAAATTNGDALRYEQLVGVYALKNTKADLPAAVAYEDEANTFTLGQTISHADGLILSANGGKDTLNLSNGAADVGVTIGTANLYNSAADTLKTDDSLIVGSALSLGSFGTISPISAKGELLVGTANDTLGVLAAPASDGLILTSLASETTGTKWQGAWTTWSPTLTNLTLGSGTVVARSCQVGKTVHYRFGFKLAADSAVGTGPTFTLPATAASSPSANNTEQIGQVSLLDAGTQLYLGIVVKASTTVAALRVIRSDLTSAADTGITSTTPFTWTTNDEIVVTGTYEAA